MGGVVRALMMLQALDSNPTPSHFFTNSTSLQTLRLPVMQEALLTSHVLEDRGCVYEKSELVGFIAKKPGPVDINLTHV